MAAGDFGTARHIKHVTHAQQLLGPHLAKDGPAVDFRGHLKGDPGGEVRLDRAGDDIDGRPLRRHDKVNARSPCHLCKALDTGFDLLTRDHHQVGHFVDDYNDIGKRFRLELIRFENGLARLVIETGLYRAAEHLVLGQCLADAAIVTFDVPDAHFRHLAVAFFHLAHDPLEGDDSLLGVRHDGRQQVRNAVIDGEFQHLGVNHDHPAFLRCQLVEQRQDHGVDGHGFARTCGTRDQQMRHLGKVRDDRVAADVLAERQRQALIAIAEIAAGEDLTQDDFFAVLVRQFDTDNTAPRHGGNPCGQGRHGARDIVGKPDHTARFQTGRGLKLVHGDDGTRTHGDDLAFDAVVIEHGFEHARIFFQRFIAEVQPFDGVGALQQVKRRKLKAGMGILECQSGLCLGLGLLAGLHRFARGLHDQLARLGCGDGGLLWCDSRFQRQAVVLHHLILDGKGVADATHVGERRFDRCRGRGRAQDRLRLRRRTRGSGERRLGAQLCGAGCGVEHQRIGAAPPAPCQRRCDGCMQCRRAAHAALDHVGDLALDTILARPFIDDHILFGFHQFRLRHRIGTFDETGHTRQQPTLGLFRHVIPDHIVFVVDPCHGGHL